jgi:two-component system OmpR family response regulator
MTVQCLFIEDDQDFLEPTSVLLSQHRIQVTPAPDLHQAHQKLKEQLYDIIILDLNLPDGNGLEFLEKISSQYVIPVIILSADFQNQSKVEALNLGAYYYLNKPIHIDELVAVIQRTLKITNTSAHLLNRDATEGVPQWILEPETWEVSHKDHSTKVKLTGKEFLIAQTLAKHVNKTVTRAQLFQLLEKPNPDYHDRSLDVLISRINKKLASLNAPGPIESVRGSGYVFKQQVEIK